MDLDTLKLIYNIPPMEWLEAMKGILDKKKRKHEQKSYRYNFMYNIESYDHILDIERDIEEVEEAYETYKRTGLGWC